MTTIPSLLTITDLPDQQANVAGSYTHTEYNLMKNNYLTMIAFVRSLVDPDTGLILASVLPPDPLDPAQFETGSNGFIQLINYDQIGSNNTPLAQSVLSAGTITSNAIQWNWTAVEFAASYNLQQFINSVWTTVYTGTALTAAISSLNASTAYTFRLVAVPASGYSSSTSATQTASTAAAAAFGTPVTAFRTPKDVTVSSNSISYPTAASDNTGIVVSSMKIASGTAFEIRGTCPASTSSGSLSVIQGTTSLGYYALIAGIKWDRESDTVGKFVGTASGVGQDNYGGEVTLTADPQWSVSGDGSRLYIKGSFDGGNTFTEIEPATVIPQPATDLYLEAFFDTAPEQLNNISQTGMVASSI